MRTLVAPLATFCAVLGLALPIAGCGDEDADDEVPEVVEGEPLELGELIYNVAITRFLNPNIVEDEAYLEGAPEEPKGMSYLGVFLLIKNEGEEEIRSAQNYAVLDGSHRVYEPVETSRRRSRSMSARPFPPTADPRARHGRGGRPDPGRAHPVPRRRRRLRGAAAPARDRVGHGRRTGIIELDI